jgi:hypothetical protein
MESQPPLFSFLSPSLHSRGGWSGVSIRQDGHLEAAEPVPFRLTRNLQSFFTAYGIEGLFIASLGATAQALTGAHSPLEHHLTLFFRDELMTHQFRPQRPGPEVCVNRTQVCVNRTQVCVNRTQVCVNRTQGELPPPRPPLAAMVHGNVQQVRPHPPSPPPHGAGGGMQSVATPLRPREDGLAHPADTSISNLAAALGLLPRVSKPT